MTAGRERTGLRLAHGFSLDLRLAARRLLATPLFTLFAVLSLAIGVAVTTASYSVVDSIFLKDLGIRDPEEVVFVVTPYDGRLLKGSITERVASDTYFAFGGWAVVSVETPVSTISTPFQGWIDSCVNPNMGQRYDCTPDLAVTRVRCESTRHRLILTRR